MPYGELYDSMLMQLQRHDIACHVMQVHDIVCVLCAAAAWSSPASCLVGCVPRRSQIGCPDVHTGFGLISDSESIRVRPVLVPLRPPLHGFGVSRHLLFSLLSSCSRPPPADPCTLLIQSCATPCHAPPPAARMACVAARQRTATALAATLTRPCLWCTSHQAPCLCSPLHPRPCSACPLRTRTGGLPCSASSSCGPPCSAQACLCPLARPPAHLPAAGTVAVLCLHSSLLSVLITSPPPAVCFVPSPCSSAITQRSSSASPFPMLGQLPGPDTQTMLVLLERCCTPSAPSCS